MFVLGVLVSLGSAYGAYQLAGYSWDQVVSYESPYSGLSGVDFSGPRPELTDSIPGAESRRTVLVLIDGLRDDASRTMESMNSLRERGADVALTVPQPSLSYPTWTTILSGAPPQISGVTTNWFEGQVSVETLIDVALGSGRSVVVAGPTDLTDLFGADRATASAFTDWTSTDYVSDDIVNDALALDIATPADFMFVLLPDVDEAGHQFGGASTGYLETVGKVDADLARLIAGLDDGATTFIVLPDHGHIDTGGHGGWEDPAIRTSAVFAGPGVAKTTAEAPLQDVAATVAVIAGMQAPAQSLGTAIDAVLANTNGSSRDAEFVRAAGFTLSYVRKTLGDEAVAAYQDTEIASPAALADIKRNADAERLATERAGRLPMALALALSALAIPVVIGMASRRALLAAGAGALTYFAVYNALFFGAHGLHWSLSAFNSESMIEAFFNQRMIEAVIAAVAGCFVASLVYAATRREPKGPQSGHAAGWLGLGVATVLLAQAGLALQVAWFLWRWGADVVWVMPEFMAAFKYDLDLIQLTALGAAALLGPLVTYLVGRFHPQTRATAS
jgi:hypothetical protein